MDNQGGKFSSVTDPRGQQQQLNVRHILKIVLSERLSISFQKKYGFPRIPIKKKEERLKHNLRELVRSGSLALFAKALITRQIYLSRYSAKELEKFLRTTYPLEPDLRRQVSLAALVIADRDHGKHASPPGLLRRAF